MSMVCPSRRVPRGEKRRDEIASVAEAVFLERGYADTTMQIIAEQAGASKETLYRHFGGKEALFSEVVRRRSFRIAGDDERDWSGPPAGVLLGFALNFLRFVTQGDSVCLLRVVAAEAPREPELGRIFYEQGPGRLLGRLTAYLSAAVAAKELNCANPTLAARLFLGAVVAHYHVLNLIGSAQFPEEEIRAHAQEAVSLFLARYQG